MGREEESLALLKRTRCFARAGEHDSFGHRCLNQGAGINFKIIYSNFFCLTIGSFLNSVLMSSDCLSLIQVSCKGAINFPFH